MRNNTQFDASEIIFEILAIEIEKNPFGKTIITARVLPGTQILYIRMNHVDTKDEHLVRLELLRKFMKARVDYNNEIELTVGGLI